MVEVSQQDRRRLPRRRTLKTGHIICDERQSPIECLVRNLSSKGALLQTPGVFSIPDNFELQVDGQTKAHTVSVVWKRDDKMGVEFGPASSAKLKALTEAGFRCSVPTCRSILLGLYPVVQIDENRDDDAFNLVALCPTCDEAYRRGTISNKALCTYKSVLTALSSAFDICTTDLLLFMAEAGRDSVLVSGDGVLNFAGLIASGYAEARVASNDGNRYAVNVTPMGRLFGRCLESRKSPTPRGALTR